MTIAERRRGAVGLAIITAIMVTGLVALGLWQLQRRAEKHALIAALTERLAASPVELPPRLQWPTLTPAKDEFRRVRFTATFSDKPDVMVYGAGSAIRSDISGPGAWAFLLARLTTGDSIIINAGFVPNTMQDRAQQDRAVRPLVSGSDVAMTGYIRFPEISGALTPPPNLAKRLWFSRDIAAMNWGKIAPFYIDLETPSTDSGVPKPGPLDVRLKDDHLQYAITWFGLALVVLGGFAAWLMQRRRT